MAKETEKLGENLPQCRFVNHKSHMIGPGNEPGPTRWETGLSFARSVYPELLAAVFVASVRVLSN
jgi:hypothetical protein